MTVAPGTRLGAYEILSPIGAGGMGEVYKARDTRLKRDVAIKVLPDAFTDNPDRLARFHREAELLATLSHPNIASVYGFEEDQSIKAIVLELVEGPTLAERISHGALPLDQARAIAKQIADALEAAHEKGIIHRDLKPANIKFTARGAPPPRAEDRRFERSLSAAGVADGIVKVLDFGLAKALDPPSGTRSGDRHDGLITNSPTITSPAMMTSVGTILGTAAYMSPEQARGRSVDKRTDIWAFGCVLFEMLTARRAFPGDDVTDTIAAIVKSEPDWSALPPETPSSMRRALERCLQKDVGRRLRDIGDARIELDAVDSEGAQRPTAVTLAGCIRVSPEIPHHAGRPLIPDRGRSRIMDRLVR
jgi:eukaryotic-like serine/threonine-protein kinase